jgi:hypothetical protein
MLLVLRCKGFNMDYNRNECQAVLESSQDNLFNLRPSTGIAFFEAICLRGRVGLYHVEDCIFFDKIGLYFDPKTIQRYTPFLLLKDILFPLL